MASSSDKQKDVATTSGSKPPENNFLVTREEYCWRCIPLVKAIITGDWDSAKRFFDQYPDTLTGWINQRNRTALDIAVGIGQNGIHFVKKLVELLPAEALALTDGASWTALHHAAWVGYTEAAVLVVQKHPRLVYALNKNQQMPMHMAAINAHRETLSYLLTVTKDDPVALPFSDQSGAKIITYVIRSNFYDIALNLIEQYPHLATLATPGGNCALSEIAKKSSAFPSGSRLKFWQRLLYSYVPVNLEKCSTEDPNKRGDIENNPPNISPMTNGHNSNWAQCFGESFSSVLPHMIKHLQEQKQIHLQALQLVRSLCEKITLSNDVQVNVKLVTRGIVTAAMNGIPEVIEEIVSWFPNSIWAFDQQNHNLFQCSVIHREENVYNLIYQMRTDPKYYLSNFDTSGNNMLHVAGRLAPPNKLNLVPGAALQMQRELQWFKEVEKIIQPAFREWKNKDNKTPAMVFTKEHENLVVEGERWMKETVNSFTTAAVLIATVAFAAAITIPGGNNSGNGNPIFANEKAKQKVFIVFAISDGISLFSSVTSLLMFLSILTSRYAEGDFLFVLPNKLIIGLVTLFLSITTMIVAFSSAFYLVFGYKVGLVVALSCLPITFYVLLQLQSTLLVDLISSTYGPGIFGKKRDRILW